MTTTTKGRGMGPRSLTTSLEIIVESLQCWADDLAEGSRLAIKDVKNDPTEIMNSVERKLRVTREAVIDLSVSIAVDYSTGIESLDGWKL